MAHRGISATRCHSLPHGRTRRTPRASGDFPGESTSSVSAWGLQGPGSGNATLRAPEKAGEEGACRVPPAQHPLSVRGRPETLSCLGPSHAGAGVLGSQRAGFPLGGGDTAPSGGDRLTLGVSDLLTETRVGPQTLRRCRRTRATRAVPSSTCSDSVHRHQVGDPGLAPGHSWDGGRTASPGSGAGAGRAGSWERSLQGRGLGHRGQEDLW